MRIRLKILLVVLSISYLAIIFIISKYVNNTGLTLNNFVSKHVCDFHFVDEINPKDDSVVPFMMNGTFNYVHCSKAQSLEEAGVKSYLNFETGVVHIDTIKDRMVTCYYSTFKRNGDNHITYSEETELLSTDYEDEMWTNYSLSMIELQTDFIQISCGSGFKYGSYERSYSFPTIAFYKNVKRNKISSNTRHESKQGSYSVFLLIIESMSRINFERWLTLTKKSIEEVEMSGRSTFYNLKGLTKVGDNSFMNLVPLLTGQSVYDLTEIHGKDVIEHGPYDSLDMVWKHFKKSGYKTSLLEENTFFSLFNYWSDGFVEEPTDYYPRPYWISVRNSDYFPTKDICYFEEPKFDILLRQGKAFNHHGQKANVPTFTFLMNIAINHDNFNELQTLDTHLSDFIQNFGNYDNTVFMLLGDHGNRFGDHIMTEIGHIEERMPFFGLFVPSSLTEAHPSIAKNLKMNEYRLTTFYDVHFMLQDVFSNNFAQISAGHQNGALSPWRQAIPSTRNCSSAKIPEIFCMCNKYQQVNGHDEAKVSLANSLVNDVNAKVEPFKQCVPQNLANIRSIFAGNEGEYLKVTIIANPSNGIYRATYYRFKSGYILKGEVTRLDPYGNQGDCLDERSLKPYCFCGG